MRAALYTKFGAPLEVTDVPDPETPPDGVVVRVQANGVCRSDWHAWIGHDPTVTLPHVPGHELAGIVETVGRDVRAWRPGDRVTVPFALGCGHCPFCRAGHLNLCDHDIQPGFTMWGAFAEFVALPHADTNLVRIPDELDFVGAASLGCRFATAFRAVVTQGQTTPGEIVAVHGCGGVGLSSIMIARALGARVIGVDVSPDALNLARRAGADDVIDGRSVDDAAEAVRDLTGGGAHVALDAVGSTATCRQSIASLRKGGRHVQVGLMLGDDRDAAVPMDRVVSGELTIVGSRGLPAHAYADLLAMVEAGRLDPGRLVTERVTLADGARILTTMGQFSTRGVVVIDQF